MSLKIADKILCSLNTCRIYLQVLTMADISTADRKLILPEVKNGKRPSFRSSTLQWLTQGRPLKEDWKHWRHYLQFLETNSKLLPPLGDWQTSHHLWNMAYYPPTGKHYIRCLQSIFSYNPMI